MSATSAGPIARLRQIALAAGPILLLAGCDSIDRMLTSPAFNQAITQAAANVGGQPAAPRPRTVCNAAVHNSIIRQHRRNQTACVVECRRERERRVNTAARLARIPDNGFDEAARFRVVLAADRRANACRRDCRRHAERVINNANRNWDARRCG